MGTSQGALREGVLYDLLGRIRHEDVRDADDPPLQRALPGRPRAGRPRRAHRAPAASSRSHEGCEIDGESGQRFLSWAAQLHEIGLSISHSGYHKHGAYLVANADMPGFSREDQLVLSALIDGQRRRFPPQRAAEIAPASQRTVLRSCLILRLAVLLARGRAEASLPEVAIEPRKDGYALRFPDAWLAERPLVQADLEQERQRLAPAGWEIDFG